MSAEQIGTVVSGIRGHVARCAVPRCGWYHEQRAAKDAEESLRLHASLVHPAPVVVHRAPDPPLTAEVERLRATVARVEALADRWQREEMPDPTTADIDLRAALAGGQS